MSKRLVDAVLEQTPPCLENGKCWAYDICKNELMACEVFWRWAVAAKGKWKQLPVRSPSPGWYEKVFEEEGD